MKRLFAVILAFVMMVSFCACGETKPSVGDQMYEKYGALINELEAGNLGAAAESIFEMMPDSGEKYNSIFEKLKDEDYNSAIAEITEMMPVPPETVVKITPENFWDYYEIVYSEPYLEQDAYGNTTEIYLFGSPLFALKDEYKKIDVENSSIEIGYTGEMKLKKIENIDWSTGEYTLGNEYFNDIAQSIFSERQNWGYQLSVSDTIKTHYADNISIPLTNTLSGTWYQSQWGWEMTGVLPDDIADIYQFVLEDVQIVRVEGTIVILND